jgi:hypothetical protein
VVVVDARASFITRLAGNGNCRRASTHHVQSTIVASHGHEFYQTLSRLHVCATLAFAQIIGSICVMVARATAPDRVGPESVFPNAATWDFESGLKGSPMASAPFWIALICQIIIVIGYFWFYRKEQLGTFFHEHSLQMLSNSVCVSSLFFSTPITASSSSSSSLTYRIIIYVPFCIIDRLFSCVTSTDCLTLPFGFLRIVDCDFHFCAFWLVSVGDSDSGSRSDTVLKHSLIIRLTHSL